jgi:hypothetical protein
MTSLVKTNLVRHLIFSFLLIGIFGTSFAQTNDDDREPISQAKLEQLLSPIALYPDTILSHILVAATYPLEVVQAARWTRKNPELESSEAVNAVQEMGWDPSVQALVAFPQILSRLNEDLQWTQDLGEAFLQDEERLLAGVQSLRQRAADAGSLDDMDKVKVSQEDEAIVIESIEREVVYVPYYDSRTIYGPWHWASHSPIYWDYPYYDRYYAYDHGRRFYWGPRVSVSFGFFFSAFNWHNHHIVRIPWHHYRNRQYYNHHQILRHNHARRWAHNPIHRRGVVYRTANPHNHFRNHQLTEYRDNIERNRRATNRDDVLGRLRENRSYRPTRNDRDVSRRYTSGNHYNSQRRSLDAQPVAVSKPPTTARPNPKPFVNNPNDERRRYTSNRSPTPRSDASPSRPFQVSKPKPIVQSRPAPQVAARPSQPQPQPSQLRKPEKSHQFENPRSRSRSNETNTRRNRHQPK